MAQPDFYFNPFDPDFRANPYPHFPALLKGPPRQLNLFMPTTLIARYDDVVTVLHDREPASGRVLEAAAQFAEAADASLVVVCASKLARDKRFEAWVGERLAAYSVHPRIESAPGDPAALQRHILGLDCGLLALAEDAEPADPDRRREIATGTGCDILVMR